MDDAISRRGAMALAGGALMARALDPGVARALSPRMDARGRLEAALAAIADPAGEGTRACLTVYAQGARAAADAADARARAGRALGPLDGVVVSIKDLFDVAGEPTRAGSRVLADAPPATADAPVVARLRAAGAVIVAKTNMSEFAFSGVGTNPHYGTPANPADRTRIPGGSTSGGAVAVADGMCAIAIGTDTGGSTRIPAALCGVVGFKPSQRRVPREGVFPLSQALDSVGPIARSVADCIAADAVIAGETTPPLPVPPLAGLRLALPQGLPLAELDATVAASFAAALDRLKGAGVTITDTAFPELDGMGRVNTPVPLVAVEAYRIHRERLAAQGDLYDPFVRARLETAKNVTDAEHAAMLRERATLIAAMDARLAACDAMILPTTPIAAPTMADVATLDGFVAKNRLLLRNTAIGNFFDLCGISLPLPKVGGLNSGLMLMARNGQDAHLLAMAQAMEGIVSTR